MCAKLPTRLGHQTFSIGRKSLNLGPNFLDVLTSVDCDDADMIDSLLSISLLLYH